MRSFLCPMAAQAPHMSYTCCIFSSTDFQCMCKTSIMYIDTNKPTAPKSSSSLHTSKCCFKMHIKCSPEGLQWLHMQTRPVGHQEWGLVRQFPISPAQARDHSQHKALATHLLQKIRCFARDFPSFASLYPAKDVHWQRQPIWKIQLHWHIKLWIKNWNISLY